MSLCISVYISLLALPEAYLAIPEPQPGSEAIKQSEWRQGEWFHPSAYVTVVFSHIATAKQIQVMIALSKGKLPKVLKQELIL